MTPKADSSSTESPPKKLPTNSAESRKSSSRKTTFHSWSHTTDDPSDTQTQSRERHPGSFDIVNVKDASGHVFATRASNIFLLGKGDKALVSLPRDKGVRKTIAEERDARIQQRLN